MTNPAIRDNLRHLGRDPTAAAVLHLLAGGQFLPLGEIAWRGRVSAPATADLLARLAEAGIVRAEGRGRARHWHVPDAAVRQAIPRLVPAPPAPRARADQARVAPLRDARSCHGHLAGRLGVAVTAALLHRGWLRADGADFRLTAQGREELAALGIDAPGELPARRCIDWSERVPHLGGPLGAALAEACLRRSWIRAEADSRHLLVSAAGQRALHELLGIEWPQRS